MRQLMLALEKYGIPTGRILNWWIRLGRKHYCLLILFDPVMGYAFIAEANHHLIQLD
ncbi:hypothetical protein ACP4OV_024757 [Aristida adscensionis]